MSENTDPNWKANNKLGKLCFKSRTKVNNAILKIFEYQ